MQAFNLVECFFFVGRGHRIAIGSGLNLLSLSPTPPSSSSKTGTPCSHNTAVFQTVPLASFPPCRSTLISALIWDWGPSPHPGPRSLTLDLHLRIQSCLSLSLSLSLSGASLCICACALSPASPAARFSWCLTLMNRPGLNKHLLVKKNGGFYCLESAPGVRTLGHNATHRGNLAWWKCKVLDSLFVSRVGYGMLFSAFRQRGQTVAKTRKL